MFKSGDICQQRHKPFRQVFVVKEDTQNNRIQIYGVEWDEERQEFFKSHFTKVTWYRLDRFTKRYALFKSVS